MSDLISRQAVIDAIKTWGLIDGLAEGQAIEILADEEKLPSAEPEIIRCKDCSNWIPGYITDNDDFIPPECGKYRQMVGHSSDDYCSLSERRTDEGD